METEQAAMTRMKNMTEDPRYSRICVMCGAAYAEDNSPTCHRCYVEEMLAQQEADEAAARHHFGEAEG